MGKSCKHCDCYGKITTVNHSHIFQNHGTSDFFEGKTHYTWLCSVAMWNYQRVVMLRKHHYRNLKQWTLYFYGFQKVIDLMGFELQVFFGHNNWVTRFMYRDGYNMCLWFSSTCCEIYTNQYTIAQKAIYQNTLTLVCCDFTFLSFSGLLVLGLVWE